ncbi:alpha-amylase family glycosyl hydrolase [Paraflavisolibacter sp. H34]|uniref:alpha-amylase family glycosyl hydrolase n=1 Tax=Huijunlia imazamoxiresistens TaxID=3127457 RepID=UPI0030199BC3
MSRIPAISLTTICLFLLAGTLSAVAQPADTARTTGETVVDNKLVIYQLLVRLFGNKNTANKFYGSKEANGTGKFNDITGKALDELKKMGVSHVWYTGVIEHATMTDYSAYGIAPDDPDVVKGRAGSPYAIKDYYDVDPDLAVDVRRRMDEYEALIARTHAHGLKVLMDFIPNHVARTYRSDAAPAGVRGFGVDDDTTKAFDPKNDFYYLPSQPFAVPEGVQAGGEAFSSPLKDGRFRETPAKATGNDVFAARPSIDDWYETIKLNYGVDYANSRIPHFLPVPPVWQKMRDILLFWAGKKVDGFRCDMAEMVPVEFWSWVIPQVKKATPHIIFIGEAYNSKEYPNYLTRGQFDFLYDKVGLYDGLKRLIRDEPAADVADITRVWKEESRGFSSRMLRFLENHDEERIASDGFAKDPWLAVPALVVSATLGSGPVMLYSGQEVGEPAGGKEGFGGDDNRTTIFDYWGVPEHQKWMNGGRFDGGGLSPDQKKLRNVYATLLRAAATQPALRTGKFYELNGTGCNNRQYAYLRYTAKHRVLVVVNFHRSQALDTKILLPQALKQELGLSHKRPLPARDLLGGRKSKTLNIDTGIPVHVPPAGACIISF